MELSVLLAAGAGAGLGASLPLRLLWLALAKRLPPAPISVWDEWLYALLHAAGGAALGLLFWLSWGLTAVVGVPWWLRGAVYGVGVTLPLLPLLLLSRLAARLPWTLIVGLLVDFLTTGLCAGLACAWNWTHAP